MSKLDDLKPHLDLAGLSPGQNVAVIAVGPHGAVAVGLTSKADGSQIGQRVLGSEAETKLAALDLLKEY